MVPLAVIPSSWEAASTEHAIVRALAKNHLPFQRPSQELTFYLGIKVGFLRGTTGGGTCVNWE